MLPFALIYTGLSVLLFTPDNFLCKNLPRKEIASSSKKWRPVLSKLTNT